MFDGRFPPVEVGSFSHYRVLYIPGDVGFLPSTVGVRIPILFLPIFQLTSCQSKSSVLRTARRFVQTDLISSLVEIYSKTLVFVPGKHQKVKWFSLFLVTPERWGIDQGFSNGRMSCNNYHHRCDTCLHHVTCFNLSKQKQHTQVCDIIPTQIDRAIALGQLLLNLPLTVAESLDRFC